MSAGKVVSKTTPSFNNIRFRFVQPYTFGQVHDGNNVMNSLRLTVYFDFFLFGGFASYLLSSFKKFTKTKLAI